MPIYAYECKTCGYRFERRQSFSENPIRVCPSCGEDAARRVISPVGIIFRGSGFYVTDNRKAASNGKAKGSSGKNGGEKTKKEEAETV